MKQATHRRLRLVFLYLALALPFVIYGAMQTLSSNVNSPLDWVPRSFPPRAAYDAFGESFGPGDTVIASWDGCTLDEWRLDPLVQALREAPQFYDAHGAWLFHSVACGREMVEQLASGSAGLDWNQAAERLRGSLVGPDAQTTCLIVAFTPAGSKQRQQLVTNIQETIERVCGVAPPDQHLAGPVIDGLSVDVASKAALDRLALPSALIVLVVACWCLRSLRMGLMVFGLSLLAQAASLALVHFCGETMSALLIVLPPLIQVLAVAGGIHLANYYFDALPEYGTQQAAAEALRRGWLPCVLSFGTTAVGMASLMLSELTPIRSFGAFSAAGVLITAGLLLGVLPALLTWWPVPPRHRLESMDERNGARRVSRWEKLTTILCRHRGGLVSASLALMVAMGIGITNLSGSVRIETLFGPESKIVGDYAWLEQHVGPLVPMEIVLSFDADCPLSVEDRMTVLWHADRAVQRETKVAGTFSAVDLLPALPPLDSIPPEQYQHILHEALVAARPAFQKAGRLVVNDAGEQWRLSAMTSGLGTTDYGRFLSRLRERLDPVLRDARHDPLPGVTAAYTGIMPLVHEIQRQMMADLFHSFLAAFAVITLVMTVAQGSLIAGLVAMIPNVFPTVVLFGFLGWSGISLDIGTVMTASIALGIAVDDTLHYVTFFQRGLAQRMPRRQAVRWAYEHCGKAMIQTSITCGLGLAVFAWSDFVPTERFAWMMVALMGLALAGDLLLLPALLLSPAGKAFVAASEVESEVEPAGAPAPHIAKSHWNKRPATHRRRAASIVSPGPNASTTLGSELSPID